MNCEKCQNRFSHQQHKAIEEYMFYCQKYCTPVNKYLLSLLEKKRLYFDIANCLFLLNDDLTKITSIFNTYSYWTSLTITSSSRYMAENIKIKILNNILSLIKTNLTKHKSIKSLSLLHLPLTTSRTLGLLYNILLHNKSIVELNIQYCSFAFTNNNNSSSNSSNINLRVNTSSNVLSVSSPLNIQHNCSHNSHNHNNNRNNKSNNLKKNISSLNTACGFYITKHYNNNNKRSNNTSSTQTTSPSTPSYTYTFKSIFQSIYYHPLIQFLSFTNNNIPDNDSSALITMMMNQHNKQKTKNWSHTLHSKYTLSSLPLKYDLYSLCHINLSHNKLGNVFAKEMSKLIANDIYLRKLDLSYNNLQYKECHLLCKSIKLNRFIVNLNLNCNPGLNEKIYIKLLLYLGKNIKYLKYCWEKGEYTESEFKRLIVEHVDKEMFQIDISVPNVVVGVGQNDVNDVNECDDEYQQQQQRNECVNVGDSNNNNKQCNLNYEEALERIKLLEEENKTLKSKMSTNSSNNNIKCKQKNKKRTKSVGFF